MIDGQVEAGTQSTLPDGSHDITASVTDSGGKSGSDTHHITVGDPPPPPAGPDEAVVTYTTTGGKNSDKHMLVTVTLEDADNKLVADTQVQFVVVNSSGSGWRVTGTTGANGEGVSYLWKGAKGCYTTTVEQVAGANWTGPTQDGANDTGFCK